MKGIFRTRPSFPKYDETWDPHPVLLMLEKLHPNESLDLRNLTIKLTLLLALSTAQRVQTLSKIKIKNIRHIEGGIEIDITDILKTSAPRKPQPQLRFLFFKDKPALCAAATILHYIDRTRAFRENEEFLILTTKKPYHHATTQTLSRWIKNGLEMSDINTDKFKGHSTRHAAASAALRSGINIEIIRNSAGWSEKSNTFCKFYNRPVNVKHATFSSYIEIMTKNVCTK